VSHHTPLTVATRTHSRHWYRRTVVPTHIADVLFVALLVVPCSFTVAMNVVPARETRECKRNVRSTRCYKSFTGVRIGLSALSATSCSHRPRYAVQHAPDPFLTVATLTHSIAHYTQLLRALARIHPRSISRSRHAHSLDRPARSLAERSFFGHSLGSLVAYEVTLELRRRGLPLPAFLIASSSPAPQLHAPDDVGEGLSPAEFVDKVRTVYKGSCESV
jgi:hypothetical protein